MPYVGIDFETYGSLDLTTVGLDNYINDPLFRPLICSLAFESGGFETKRTYEFVGPESAHGRDLFMDRVYELMKTHIFVAHNADFERRVLQWFGFEPDEYTMLDSAVIARIQGADSHLENAAPQLTGVDKLAVGKRLIKKFCIGEPPTDAIVEDEDWPQFKEYCELDATLGFKIARLYQTNWSVPTEQRNEAFTSRMNLLGWNVDLDSVRLMQARAEANKAAALEEFRNACDPKGELNLGSHVQVKKWVADRGIKWTSFDEANVVKLLDKVDKLLSTTKGTVDRLKLLEIKQMLLTKQVIGGSSLSKLPTILNLTGEDGRLRHQYMHCGAGQTYRTSGRGVQLQNLKRMGALRDMDELADPSIRWTNEDLADNIRQCFTATNPQGELIVGDLGSIESRGLAWLAGENWKLDAYRLERDVYKVLAAKFTGTDYDDITPAQRQLGKVAELSCGYGIGPVYLRTAAEKHGLVLDELQSLDLVRDWRQANARVVKLWDTLQRLLEDAIEGDQEWHPNMEWIRPDTAVSFTRVPTPASLVAIRPGAHTIRMELQYEGQLVLQRVFQGCYMRGNQIAYYKPSRLASGKLWHDTFMDPKTKRPKFYGLYGGKLTGILVQSFCREIFFDILKDVEMVFSSDPGVGLIGQFHDELVLDYNPALTIRRLEQVKAQFHRLMSRSTRFKGLPMAAEVKSSYRYTK